MGTEATATGYISLPANAEAAALNAFTAAQSTGTERPESIEGLLSDVLSFEVQDITEILDAESGDTYNLYQLWYCGKWYAEITDDLSHLAGVGGTGVIDYTAEGDQWKVSLDAGTCRYEYAVTYFPHDPDPNAPRMALNQREVRVLLALVAGDHVEGIDEVVKKLSDALN